MKIKVNKEKLLLELEGIGIRTRETCNKTVEQIMYEDSDRAIEDLEFIQKYDYDFWFYATLLSNPRASKEQKTNALKIVKQKINEYTGYFHR